MKKLYFLLAGIAAILVLWSCEDNNVVNPNGLPNDARVAATILLDSLQVDSTAEVFVVGPLPAGTVLREFLPDTTDTTAATIQLPVSDEPKYVFFINDHKEMNWSHRVRYAWVGIMSGEVEFVGGMWPMLIEHPAGFQEPFDEQGEETLDGVKFRFGTGGGSYLEDPDGDKPGDTLRANNESGRLQAPDTGRKSSVALDAPCKKIGYLFDAGEWSECWGKQGFSAGAMADNAGLVESFLTDNGFTTTRNSQYKGNDIPAIKGGDIADKLKDKIQSFAAEFECPCDGDPGCHEFFLYICAHGEGEVVSLYEPRDPNWGWFKYQYLNDWLDVFPPCVKVIVFLDICNAGSAQDDLEAQCNLRADCGFTLIMSCGPTDSTPAGLGATDSGTEDWAEGEGEDYDNDGKEGDLGDRWLNLEDENEDYNPQRFMCPGQTAMCSTD
jgi:hypothetical protein